VRPEAQEPISIANLGGWPQRTGSLGGPFPEQEHADSVVATSLSLCR